MPQNSLQSQAEGDSSPEIVSLLSPLTSFFPYSLTFFLSTF